MNAGTPLKMTFTITIDPAGMEDLVTFLDRVINNVRRGSTLPGQPVSAPVREGKRAEPAERRKNCSLDSDRAAGEVGR